MIVKLVVMLPLGWGLDWNSVIFILGIINECKITLNFSSVGWITILILIYILIGLFRIRDGAQNSTEKFSSKAYGTGMTEFTGIFCLHLWFYLC